MPALTAELRAEYESRYAAASILPERAAAVGAAADRIRAGASRYQAVSATTGVPWWFIGILHQLESGGDFSRHLHNGDPLTGRTTHVPAGRPPTGSPPFTWEQSAQDALAYAGLSSWSDWSIAGTLYRFESYNGFGYRSRGVPSPYLWSWTTQAAPGRYTADGQYDPTASAQQPGAAALLLALGGTSAPSSNGGGLLLLAALAALWWFA